MQVKNALNWKIFVLLLCDIYQRYQKVLYIRSNTNYIDLQKITTILKPGGAPLKRLREQAAQQNVLYDATAGHKTRSVIVMTTKQIILCALTPTTLRDRISEETSRTANQHTR